MKKILIALLVLTIFAVGGFLTFKEDDNDFIRIHIRANSNTEIDQNVKLLVRDKVVNVLIPLLANAENKEMAKEILTKNIEKLENVANMELKANGFVYQSTAKMKKETFPTRQYGDLVLESGEYDALIINLGSGEGDNWWCVAFPPLCFVPTGGTNIKYKSKILEIIEMFKREK